MDMRSLLTISMLGVASKSYGSTSAQFNVRDLAQFDWLTGTGASQADSLFVSRGTLVEGSTTSFDFIGGGLVDPFGTAIAFATLRALFIQNRDTGTSYFNITSTITGVPVGTIYSGGVLFGAAAVAAQWPVVAGSDTVDVECVSAVGGATAAYTLIAIGTTA